MNFGQSISTCMGKYATFSGRASRSEFWWFYLFTILLQWGASIVGAVTMGGDPFAQEIWPLIISLALLLPILAATTRRLHDIGRTGWWQLLFITIIGAIVVVIFCALDTQMEENKYGPIPNEKAPGDSDKLTTTPTN